MYACIQSVYVLELLYDVLIFCILSLTAPVPGTVNDFWQMMWDQRINIVVMLTKTMEGSKVQRCTHA